MANPYMGAPTMYGSYDPYSPGAPFPYAGMYKSPYNSMYGSQTPQTVPQTIPQQVQPQMNGQSLQCIQVPNADYAKSVVLNPNQTLYMVSQNAPELYAKTTDPMGVATMKYFKLVEFDPTMEAAQQAVNNQIGNVVSREEFNQFANNVAAQFNAIQQGFSNGNVNLQQSGLTPVNHTSVPSVAPVSVNESQASTKSSTNAGKKKETATA